MSVRVNQQISISEITRNSNVSWRRQPSFSRMQYFTFASVICSVLHSVFSNIKLYMFEGLKTLRTSNVLVTFLISRTLWMDASLNVASLNTGTDATVWLLRRYHDWDNLLLPFSRPLTGVSTPKTKNMEKACS